MNTNINIFRASKEYPYHLSVGAVVMNDENNILCHHFAPSVRDGQNYPDLYLLMRETLENNETIEQCVERGLKEEFGVRAELKSLLGSNASQIDDNRGLIKQKTVVYFLCKFIEYLPEGRLKNDPESKSNLEWHDSRFLISKMFEQGKKLNRQDIDESEIIRRINLDS